MNECQLSYLDLGCNTMIQIVPPWKRDDFLRRNTRRDSALQKKLTEPFTA